MNPVDDPEFYCHGQECIDHGCNPLRCEQNPDNDPGPFCPQNGYGCMGCEACG